MITNYGHRMGWIKGIVISTIIGVISIIIIASITSGLRRVNYDEVGISYDKLSKKINYDKILTQGRYLVTPTSTIFIYKRTLQTIDLTGNESVTCISKEGLTMVLSVQTQYQIDVDRLFDIFSNYGPEENYSDFLKSMTQSAIRDICADYSAMAFFTDRANISQSIASYLTYVYNFTNSYSFNILTQLVLVTHPSDYEQATQDLSALLQQYFQALNQRTELLISAQTSLSSSIITANIAIVNANASSDAIIQNAQSQYDSEYAKWYSRTNSLMSIKNKIPGITNIQLFNEYLKYYAIKENINMPIVQF